MARHAASLSLACQVGAGVAVVAGEYRDFTRDCWDFSVPLTNAPGQPPAPDGAPTLMLPPRDDAASLTALQTLADAAAGEGAAVGATLGRRAVDAPALRPQLPSLLTHAASAAAGRAVVALGKTLGVGGMGVVVAGEQHSLGREVAVKRVRDDGSSPHAAARLCTEATLTGALQHPNIVPVYELGLDEEGQPLMVMKRIDGAPWQVALRDAPLPGSPGHGDWLEAQLRVLLDVCDAVRYAHSRGIVHRDLKPDNVMLGSFGEVVVVDWGVAVSVDPAHRGRFPLAAESRHIAGTPAYMAPEQAEARGEAIGPWTDVFLLGAMLYELLTGRPPHERDTVHASIFAAFRCEPAPLPAWVAAPLAELCGRALRREPSQRHGDVASFRDELAAFLRHRASIEITDHAARLAAEVLATAPADAPDGASQVDPQGVHKRFAAARFGFQQALQIWPGNERARDGLQALLEAMIARSIDAAELTQAALLAEELPQPAPALLARLRAARHEAAARQRDLRQLGDIGQRHDFRVGLSQRMRFVIGLAGINGAIAAAEAWALDHGRLSPELHAGIAVVQMALLLVYGVVRWQPMRSAGVNHRLFHVATLTVGALTMERLLALHIGAPIAIAVAFENLLLLVGIGASSAFTRRTLAPAMLAYALGALGGATMPALALWFLALAHVLGIGFVGWVWRDLEAASPRSP